MTRWINSVQSNSGYVARLACDLVLMTALRKSEVSCFRVDTIPLEPRDWHIANPTDIEARQQVVVHIKYGAKGPKLGVDHGDKIGPGRVILIPLLLVKRLHEYRLTLRAKQISAWVKTVPGAKAQNERRLSAVHLFRDERTGDRLTARRLYSCWTQAELPFAGWSPHKGRHWWACATLWRKVMAVQSPQRFKDQSMPLDLMAYAKDVIRLEIQEQLGHSSIQTSLIYLRWLRKMLAIPVPEDYRLFLEAGDF